MNMSDKKGKIENEEELEPEKQDEISPSLESEWEDKYKRVLADYQNLEKRVRDERVELIRSSNRELLLRFLPILDTVLLAKQHEDNQNLKIVEDQFLAVLKTEGVTRIKTVGEQFDPAIMEVVTTVHGQEGIVIQEVRSGYLLYDKLLRPAQVIVGNGEKN